LGFQVIHRVATPRLFCKRSEDTPIHDNRFFIPIFDPRDKKKFAVLFARAAIMEEKKTVKIQNDEVKR
jgi:hypothetical protein